MTEHDKQQTTSGLSSSDRSDQRGSIASPLRRRLVKGTALALPAIMTLPSGSAQAAASIYTCKMKAGMAGNGTKPPGVDLITFGDPDNEYHRVAVEVRGTDNKWAPGVMIYHDTSSVTGQKWRKFDGTVVDPNPSTSTDPEGTQIMNQYYALAFVNQYGEVVALAPPGFGQYAACSDNCFNSTGLMPHNP